MSEIALEKIANYRLKALERQLPFAQLVEKINQENNKRTHTERHKIKANTTLSTTINNINTDIVNLTADDVKITAQDETVSM